MGAAVRRVHLTGAEICDIIKACKDAGVTQLQLDSLVISFVPVQNELVQGIATPSGSSELGDVIPRDLEQQVRQQQVDELLISDPLAYEKMQLEE